MSWLFLAGAIGLELIGTTALKLSDGMTRLTPTVVVIVCYLCCFTLLAKALRTLEVGIAYAIWSGIGTAGIALIGLLLFKESLSPLKLVSLLLIVAGVVGLNLASQT